jgi:hypothetical protein
VALWVLAFFVTLFSARKKKARFKGKNPKQAEQKSRRELTKAADNKR